MKKFPLLLLDANVIIYLHELELWDKFVCACEVTLTRTILNEAKRFSREDADYLIDLSEYEQDGRISVIDLNVADLHQFKALFSPGYLERLDDGEAESLAYLHNDPADWIISSGDSIVYKVLAQLNCVNQGLSLEEILGQTGLGRRVSWPYSKDFREHWTKKGQEEMIKGMGLK